MSGSNANCRACGRTARHNSRIAPRMMVVIVVTAVISRMLVIATPVAVVGDLLIMSPYGPRSI